MYAQVAGNMNIEEQKNIIATFLGISPNEVTSTTKIDREALQGSVKIHRLRSALKATGVNPSSWENINTFGDLNGTKYDSEPTNTQISISSDPHHHIESPSTKIAIGIDIESEKSIPDTSDYFEDQFFKDNFSGKEISYCSRAANPKACFAGRFAAKEAIFKATKGDCGKDFSKIEIDVLADGSPTNNLCSLSISHLNEIELSIAVAIPSKLESASLNESASLDIISLPNETQMEKPSVFIRLNNILLWALVLSTCSYIVIKEIFPSIL